MIEQSETITEQVPENARPFPHAETRQLLHDQKTTLSLRPDASIGVIEFKDGSDSTVRMSIHGSVTGLGEDGSSVLIASRDYRDRKNNPKKAVYVVRAIQDEKGTWRPRGIAEPIDDKFRSFDGRKRFRTFATDDGVATGLRARRSGDRVVLYALADAELTASSEKLRHRLQRVGSAAVEASEKVTSKTAGIGGVLAVAALATLAPGKGLLDRVEDPFVDAEARTEQLVNGQRFTQGDLIYEYLHSDGEMGLFAHVPELDQFKNMTPAELETSKDRIAQVARETGQPVLSDILKEDSAKYESEDAAIDRVARVFGELDDNNVSGIEKRAQETIRDNPDQYITQTEVDGVTEAIERSRNPQELREALEATLAFYGKKIDTSDVGDDMGNAKRISRSILTVLSSLPRDFVREHAKFETIILGDVSDHASIQDTAFLKIQGLYNGKDIILQVHNSDLLNGSAAVQMLDSPGELMEANFAHELSHSLDLDVLPSAPEGSDGSALEFVRHTASYLFGSPSRASIYTLIASSEDMPMDGQLEHIAETMGGAINDNIAHPDMVRQFDSRLNAQRLQTLAQIEIMYPGATEVLLTRNGTTSNSSMETIINLIQYGLAAKVFEAAFADTRAAARLRRRVRQIMAKANSSKK